MSEFLKLELSLDPSKPKQLLAFSEFLTALAGDSNPNRMPAPKEETVTEKAPEPAKATASKSRAAAKPKETAPAPKEEDKSTEEASADAPTKDDKKGSAEAAPASTIKLDDIRSIMQTKITDHRDALKNKLTELGAKNVTVLDPAHYGDFMDFIQKLA